MLKSARHLNFVILLLALVAFGPPPTGIFPELARASADDRPGPPAPPYTSRAIATPPTRACLTCHAPMTPNLVTGWERGRHAEAGVGCHECHRAEPGDPDAQPDHHGHSIATLVTPGDCGRCHPEQARSFAGSAHARAADIASSTSWVFGAVVAGQAAVVTGCNACHGSTVRLAAETRRPTPDTWPNSGVGRINPDGTRGACSACHPRHDFRRAVTRRPETCGRCHQGPDHPQLEVWQASKHGQTHELTNRQVAAATTPAVLGRDPVGTPTCLTCHLGPTTAPATARLTHDPGERRSWNLRDPTSTRTPDWQARRTRMQSVCRQCHGGTWVQHHYTQFDKAIALYNNRYIMPANEIVTRVRAAGKLSPNPVDDRLERDHWQLWHHEGRRARNGAAMMGADVVQWLGFYDVALRFYFDLLPEAERLVPGVTADIAARPEHRWLTDRIHTPADLRAAIDAGWRFWDEVPPDPVTGSTTAPAAPGPPAPEDHR